MRQVSGELLGECCCESCAGCEEGVLTDPALKTTYHMVLTDGVTTYEEDLVFGADENNPCGWSDEFFSFLMVVSCVEGQRTFTFFSSCFSTFVVIQATPVGVHNVTVDADCFGSSGPGTLTITEVP